MNILVTNISAFSRQTQERKYIIQTHEVCAKDGITASHTNESVVKCLVAMRDVQDTGGINKIIALVSNKSLTENNNDFGKTALEYYREKVTELYESNSPEIVVVPLEDENGNAFEMSQVLSNLCDNISEEDRVYIDVAGGRRTENNLIQLLTKILKYKGIEQPYSLYSDINGSYGKISDTADFDKMMALSDAFNEFMTTGKSDQLKNCFQDPLPEITELLDRMSDFSDSIRLGNVDSLDQTIRGLKLAVQYCNMIPNSDIETVILKQSLPVIEKKLLSDGDGVIDYCKIVQWCLDNALIQQALTVFVEKMPLYVFDQKIISRGPNFKKEESDYQEKRKKIPSKPVNLETDILYSQLLYHWNIDLHANLFDEFKRSLLDNFQSKENAVVEAVELVGKFREFDAMMKSKCVDKIIIEEISRKRKIQDYDGLIESLTQKPNSLAGMFLGLEKGLIDDKFCVIDAIGKGEARHQSYKWKCPDKDMANLLYGYMYVKLLRNQTNHASSEENFTDDYKAILTKHGFDFTCNNLHTVKQNIMKSLSYVQKAEASVIEKRQLKQAKAKEKKAKAEAMKAELAMKKAKAKPAVKEIKTEIPHLEGPKILGKIDLNSIK